MAKAVERPLVGMVGGDTLLGREIRELLGESKHKPRIQLLASAPDGSTAVAAEEDEALVMAPMNAKSLEGAKAAFLAASPAASRRAAKVNPQGGPVLIDLTGALEDQPQARLRAPFAEPPGRERSRPPRFKWSRIRRPSRSPCFFPNWSR